MTTAETMLIAVGYGYVYYFLARGSITRVMDVDPAYEGRWPRPTFGASAKNSVAILHIMFNLNLPKDDYPNSLQWRIWIARVMLRLWPFVLLAAIWAGASDTPIRQALAKAGFSHTSETCQLRASPCPVAHHPRHAGPIVTHRRSVAMQMQVHITDERGRRRRATVRYDAFDHQVAWVAEIEDNPAGVPLSGTAADEASVAPAVQVAALRWGIGKR